MLGAGKSSPVLTARPSPVPSRPQPLRRKCNGMSPARLTLATANRLTVAGVNLVIEQFLQQEGFEPYGEGSPLPPSAPFSGRGQP